MSLKCSVHGCESKREALGLCGKHYARQKAHGDPNKLLTLRRDSMAELLRDGARINAETGCHEWVGTIKTNGYGSLMFQGKMMLAHRASFEHFKGPLVAGLNVNHKCDNRPCINPDHLYQGTQEQNIADMIERKRIDRRGEKGHAIRKLSEIDVRLILSSDESNVALAATYGVSRDAIYSIRTGRTWSHI
jgi:hypothetical protein